MANDIQAFILSYLNNPPFEHNFTPLQFDQLPSNQLLQILSDVLSTIFQNDNIDIRRESAEDTAIRILNLLRILRYRPPTDSDELEEWRAGIVEGSKSSVYPLLVFLFENYDALKERAYLAKFLMKTEVPSDIYDYDTAELQNEINELMEEFKQVHAENKIVQADISMLEDIKQDLKSMEKEKQLLLRKIEKTEKKVQNIPYFERHLEIASQLRVERDRVSEYTLQKHQERQRIVGAENRVARLKTMLDEIRSNNENVDQASLIEKFEDELATNTYLVNEKLRVEIENREKLLKELTAISRTNAIKQDDINKLNNEVEELSKRIKQLEEERDQHEEEYDDNMSVFRHQVNALERKKELAVQKLQNTRQDLAKLEKDVEARKNQLQNEFGGEVLSTVQYKKYLDRFRARNEEHKRKRRELNDLYMEKGILKRTVDILSDTYDELRTNIENLGGEVVEVLHVPNMAERPKTAAPQTEDIEELKAELKSMVGEMEERKKTLNGIRQRRDDLKTSTQKITQKLENLRQQKQQMDNHREESNQNILSVISQLEKELNDEKEELPKYKDDLASLLEDKNKLLQYSNDMESLEKRLKDAEDQENDIKMQMGSMGSLESVREQAELWSSLHAIFKLKKTLLDEKINSNGI